MHFSRSSFGDLPIILASYGMMLIYVVLSLGKISSWKRLCVDVKLTLAVCGTIVVLLSITSAVGVYGHVGVPTTLIIFQILPFLVSPISYPLSNSNSRP